MINRYRLNRDADGFMIENDRGKEDKRFQPNFIRKVFNRFDGNFQTEQLDISDMTKDMLSYCKKLVEEIERILFIFNQRKEILIL